MQFPSGSLPGQCLAAEDGSQFVDHIVGLLDFGILRKEQLHTLLCSFAPFVRGLCQCISGSREQFHQLTLIFSVPGDAGTSSYRSSKAITKNVEAGKFYRSAVQMTVQSDDATYVPMGDGKKWALKNVGAANPEDYGDYFAWGETEPKSGYNWANYGFTTDGGRGFGQSVRPVSE